MRRPLVVTLASVVVFGLVALFVWLTSRGYHPRESAGATAVIGWATGAGPIAGADVTFLSAKGKVLARGEGPTLTTGLFTARVEDLPANFTVVVPGGTDDGKPLQGGLRNDVVGHRTTQAVYVNPATTLESVYHTATGASYTLARTKLRRYFGLPRWIDYERHLRVSDRWLSGRRLEEEAAQHGGRDVYLRQLAAEVDRGGVRSFAAAPSNDGAVVVAKELVRRTGLTHAQVNTELNRLSGVRRVAEATIEQLEQRQRAGDRWLAKP